MRIVTPSELAPTGVAGPNVADGLEQAGATKRRHVGQASRQAARLASSVSGLVRSPMVTLLWFGAAVLLGVAPSVGMPLVGFDSSWIAAINLAAAANLRFGHDIVFNYGPWGYLDWPLHTSWPQAVLGFGFATAATIATFCAVYVCVRRNWSDKGAGPIAFAATVATTSIGPGARFVCAGLVFALLTLERRSVVKTADRRDAWPAVFLAVLGALLLQVKFSEGVAVLVLAGLLALCVDSLRSAIVNAGLSFASFALSFLTLWLAAHQRISDILPWSRGSQEISSGYQEALAIESPEFMVGYLLAVVLVMIVGTLAFRMLRRRRGVAALGVIFVSLAMLEFGFKHGFTRHDTGHEISFFVFSGFLLIAFSSWSRRPAPVLVAGLCALAMLPIGFAAYDPFSARNQWRTSAELMFDNSLRTQMINSSQTSARDHYQLSPNIVAGLQNHPVHVDPSEATLPWAYSLTWAPIPVFQPYSAYTPYLDELNAQAIVEAPGDQIVLREDANAIDNRNVRWDTPRYLLALACNYTMSANDEHWSLLRHSSNRCSQPRTLDVRRVEAGVPLEPPKVGVNDILVARFTPQSGGPLKAVLHTVLKDWSPIMATADGESFRLPEALADGPLLVALPASIGWAKPFDDFHYQQLSFNHAGSVEFQVIAVQ